MGAYRAFQDTAAQELESLSLSREQRTARLLNDAHAFIASRWPNLADDPFAVMAALHCREQGMPATLIPDVRDQLAERSAA